MRLNTSNLRQVPNVKSDYLLIPLRGMPPYIAVHPQMKQFRLIDTTFFLPAVEVHRTKNPQMKF
jgi:hypothetical protein